MSKIENRDILQRCHLFQTKEKKVRKTIFAVVLGIGLLCNAAISIAAEDKATPEEVYDKVVKAAAVIEQLGSEGLTALNDTKEFIWKDSYVWAVNCVDKTVAAHPDKKYIGLDITKIYDKNEDPAKRKMHNVELCAGAQNPYGVWVEYWWEKLGSEKPARKISFMIQVPGQPYAVTAGIYDEKTTIETLEKTMY